AKNMPGGYRPHNVSPFVTILRDQCKPRLELKPELIDQLLTEPDNNVRGTFLSRTLPPPVRATPELGLEVERSYIFGHDLALLLWGLDSNAQVRIHPELTPLRTVATLYQLVIERAGPAGAPQEMIVDLKAAQAEFDKEFAGTIGTLNPKFDVAQ